MAESAVQVAVFLAMKVPIFFGQQFHRHTTIKSGIDDIGRDLQRIQAILVDAEGAVATESMRNLVNDIRSVCHDMEDVLDSFMIEAPRHSFKVQAFQGTYDVLHDLKHRRPLMDIELKIKKIINRTKYICSSNEFNILSQNVAGQQAVVISQHEQQVFLEDDDVMGIEEHKIGLIDQLHNDEHGRCQTISIVGPGGAGKTVLADRVYNSKEVISHFHCRARICVSQSFTADEFIRCLLLRFYAGIDEPHIQPGEDISARLRSYLHQKRYIIVLDYVSTMSEWVLIKKALPDEGNGSRIIITTRDDGVASSCYSNHVLRISGLPWKQSWRLFCWKAFGNKNGECPKELLDLSQRIVTRCDLLPQAISAVGSLLSTKPQMPYEWQKVHNNLGQGMGMDRVLSTIGATLLPSYYALPKYHKSCLLYFCMLPEDYSIKRDRLIRLWVAEGLVSHSESMEDTAEEYLNDLITRNLVQACRRDFNGRVKSCRVLNLTRRFILLKAKEELFASVIKESEGVNPGETIRRLSFHSGSMSVLSEGGGLPLGNVRSLFLFGVGRRYEFSHFSDTLRQFRLLKVLDLENMPLESFPMRICDILLLRYLSLRNTNVSTIPGAIKKLRYLEFLDLKHTRVTCLPGEIWSLQHLRHLLVYSCNIAGNYDTFEDFHGAEVGFNFQPPSSLQKLSTIKSMTSNEFFVVLGKLYKLQKLGLVDLRAEDASLLCSSLDHMDKLSTLNLRSAGKEVILNLDPVRSCPPYIKHLYLKGRLQNIPYWVGGLNNLVRILLKWSQLPISPIVSLQGLPNLMELEMVDACTEEVLIFEEGGFPKLRTLRIVQFERLDTVSIIKSMPKLQKLTISRCGRLHDIPYGIEELQVLEEFLLYEMPSEFTQKLRKKSEDHWRISHIASIRSYKVGLNASWEMQNLD